MPDEIVRPQKARLELKLEPYVAGDSFEDYLVLVDNYFAFNELVDESRKVRLLIHSIGSAAAIKVIKAFKPDDYSKKTYKEVITQCKTLFVGERNQIVERFRFNERRQKEGESMDDFALDLQSLVDTCGFKNCCVDNTLRDRFVSGVFDTRIKRKLLELPETTGFKAAVNQAKKEELTRREATLMSVPGPSVNRVDGRGRVRPDEPKVERASWRERSRSRSRSPSERLRCYSCNGLGHLSRFCKVQRRKFTNQQPNRYGSRSDSGHSSNVNSCIDDLSSFSLDNQSEIDSDTITLNSILGKPFELSKAHLAKLTVDGRRLVMEVDTGSPVSVCSLETYESLFRHRKLVSIERMPLAAVSGVKLELVGRMEVRVESERGQYVLYMIVIKTHRQFLPLMGRDWLSALNPTWRASLEINAVKSNQAPISIEIFRAKAIEEFKSTYPSLFDDDLTKPIRGFTVDIRMNQGFRPFVHKPYTVPFNLRERVAVQLDQLENAGIIEKIEYAECASPMVVVAKTDNGLRLCFDGSVTINPHIETHHYPLPVIDELLANKGGAKWFCVLDLKGAYQQLIVNDRTKRLLAINTIKGLYAYKRLPFGVKPAASIFQSVMDEILQGLPKVQAYIDDLLIWGENLTVCYESLKSVMERLAKYNVKLNFDKCKWFVDKVTYLGHVISSQGISPNQEKIKAIIDAPTPKNVSELKALLGMVQYYSKFLPNLNITFAPLYHLLKKGADWEWTERCQSAFDSCKRALSSEKLLAHYDPTLPMIITCDASNEGIAGVLSHVVNGQERPVMYVSRALKPAERNYPVLHREALAIVFAMEKFYKYVYGHFVEIFTDHKPLEGIFMGKRGAPSVVATRLQRYVWRLSHFNYSLKYKKGAENGNADCLSRLPIQGEASEADEIEMKCDFINAVNAGNEPFVSMDKIEEATELDEQLKRIRSYIVNGWTVDSDKKRFKAFFTNRHLLDVYSGCVIYERRVVIPKQLQASVLKLLHANHDGVVRMKQVARKRIFWEGLNNDIETYVKECEACQLFQKDKPDKVYGQWAVTSFPFERIHLDFFHFQGATFLILVDAFSRWMEIKRMSRTNAASLKVVLISIFTTFGYPREIVSDNGPPFDSFEMKEFYAKHSIKETHSPPYHPASNGLAERAVQTAKSVLRKFASDNPGNFLLDRAIENFLFNYRNTPHTQDNIIPARLIMNFTPRSHLSALNELNPKRRKVSFNVPQSSQRAIEISSVNRHHELKDNLNFVPNELVLYLSRNAGFCHATRAKILEKRSDNVFLVGIGDSVKKLAHRNQLRKSLLKPVIFPSVSSPLAVKESLPVLKSNATSNSCPDPVFPFAEVPKMETPDQEDEPEEDPPIDVPLAQRKPARAKKSPLKYQSEAIRRRKPSRRN